VRKWPAGGWIAVVFFAVAALPQPVRAQAEVGGPRTELPPIAATERTRQPAAPAAGQPEASGDNPQPGPADGAALPAWPPSQGGLFGRFREDLSKPLTPKQKFTRAIEQALFPGLPGTALAAGIGMAADSRLDRDYGMGARGFLQRWGSAFGDNGVGIVVGDYAMASLLHQDPRYHPEKRRGFGRRLGHALAAVVITQSDGGQTEFNASHLTGLAAGAGAATAWHHASDRKARFFGERFGYELAVSAGYNVLAEFLFYRKEPRQ